MLHPTRTYNIDRISTFMTPEALVQLLASSDHWVLCAAFYCMTDNIIWLNDSVSQSSLQEYALCRLLELHEDHAIVQQLETVSVNWCSPEQLLRYHRRAASGELEPWGAPFAINIHPFGQYCRHCA